MIRRYLLTLSVVLALTASACGPTSDQGGAGGDSQPTEATVPAPPISAPASPSSPAPAPGPGAGPADSASARSSTAVAAPVRVGAQVLADEGFARLRGQRVGVVLNQASQVGGRSLLDVLAAAPDVHLVAAFAPEHGVRGVAPAGAAVADEVDPATGVTVHSLYGATRAPGPAVLATIDVLVFDLQDVGARPYTYVSTMGLAMQAAAAAGVRFVVLDRPDPLGGGDPADPTGGGGLGGPVLEPALASFVGRYPVPLAHGLTTGELARMIQAEHWLPGLDALRLEVVPMAGWHRADRWSDTGLPWVAPSPGLPTPEAAEVYPGTVLFEATTLSVGGGTDHPYTQLGAPWVDPDGLAAGLNQRNLPGVRFDPVRFTPAPTPWSPHPRLEGQVVPGVRVVVTDQRTFRPADTGVVLLAAFIAAARAAGQPALIDRPASFDRLAGTTALRLALARTTPPEAIVASWADALHRFDQLRQPYLLYS